MKKVLFLTSLFLTVLQLNAQVFYKGADMGWMTEYESKGYKWYNNAGQEQECLSLLKDYGINAVRLRVWVDPSKHDNWCNLEDVLVKARRAKKLGMEIMLDFHYSDWWADPNKQPIPASWLGHSFEQMKKDVRAHTLTVLKAMKKEGLTPKWVQVGNEISNGLLWSVKTDPVTGWEIKDEKGNTTITTSMGHARLNPTQYAGFIKAGYDAVKEIAPESQVIVHLDNGFDKALYEWNLGILAGQGVKWDIIGMSLYPYWAMDGGKERDADACITHCMENIRIVSEKYNCDVIITETGFEVDERHPEVMEDGYRQLCRVLQESRYAVNGRCQGVFYWEPECKPSQYKLGAFTEDLRPTRIMDAFKEYPQEKKLVALSFDDGPNTVTTPAVLAKLHKHHVLASFFVIGNNITPESELLMKLEVQQGHELANHSYSHAYMTKLSADSIQKEIQETTRLIELITNQKVTLFRPPYIDVDEKLHNTIDLTFIAGHDCEDWNPEVSAQERAERELAKVHDGSIILMHDFQGNANTVEALDILIPALKEKGYEFVTVSELFRRKGITPKKGVIYTNVLQ